MSTSAEYVIGVDPGLSGALALLNVDGRLEVVDDMPALDGRVVGALLTEWCSYAHVGAVGIELVGAMPGQGVSSMFKFGASAGVVHGAFGVTGHRIIDVRPMAWKKSTGIRTGKANPRAAQKEQARLKAIERWPDMAGCFARKKDAGRAEAALIAEHTLSVIRGEL